MKMRVAMIVLAILLVAGGGGLAYWYFAGRVVKPDFDQVGGTILDYEIDPGLPGNGAVASDAAAMARAMQARLDPDDRGWAIVSTVGKDRVEIRLPRTNENHA